MNIENEFSFMDLTEFGLAEQTENIAPSTIERQERMTIHQPRIVSQQEVSD